MYRCEVCTAVSMPRQPLIRHTFYRRGLDGRQEISREIRLCPGCKARLNAGEQFDALLQEAQQGFLANQEEMRRAVVQAPPPSRPTKVVVKPSLKRYAAVPL